VQNAIANVQQDLDVAIEENTAPDGTVRAGSFLVIVDDGTGYPSSGLLSIVASAVESVRPIGTTFAVVAPQVLTVNVTLTAVIALAAAASQSISSIQNYIAIYLDSLPIGRGASVTRVAQNAYLAGSGIENVAAIQLNGSSSDIIPPPRTVIKSGEILVTTNEG
jgi:hypothetical protein